MAALKTNPSTGKSYLATTPTGGEGYSTPRSRWNTPEVITYAEVLDAIEKHLRAYANGTGRNRNGTLIAIEKDALAFLNQIDGAKKKK